MKKPLLLMILDGYGISNSKDGNAIAQAKKPTLDYLFNKYPHSKLEASGESVGLPKGQIGNSEVGHLNIGAGKVVYTGLSLVNKSIEEGTFKKNSAFLDAFKHVEKNNSTLHIMGLLSPGGVHSQEEHIFELIKAAKEAGVKNLMLHAFGDGRDVNPKSILPSIQKAKKLLDDNGYTFASLSGRFYAMDRDSIFERTNKAFDQLLGKYDKLEDPIKYVEDEYSKDITDEFLNPTNFKGSVPLSNDDAVIFANFRPDRARQLAHLIIGSNLYQDHPEVKLQNIFFVSMMKYEGIHSHVAFDQEEVKEPMGKIVAEHGLKQLRIAETQKYAHVTFFMDGGNDEKYENEDRILVNSLKIDSFATAPEMSANKITDKLLEKMAEYDLIILNFANPDMVGHTGDFNATIKAIEVIDSNVKRIYDKSQEIGGTIFLTADHGNAESMLDDSGKPATKHSTSDVPFLITDNNIKSIKDGKLANIAPTVLKYLNIEIPSSYEEEPLI